MLQTRSRAFCHFSRIGALCDFNGGKKLFGFSYQNYAKVAAAVAPCMDSLDKGSTSNSATIKLILDSKKFMKLRLESEMSDFLVYLPQVNCMVNLDKMFWSKPSSLALAPDSSMRIEEPKYEGIKHFLLKLMLFYSKQSKSIRGANVVYRRIISQVDKPAIYNVFNLDKTFKTTFSLLVLHMWLFLRRLKEDGKEGVDFGQYLYEIYNHDVELRVSKAGVNLLLTRWMKDLEKIFYGNIVAYDAALLPEAGKDELQNVIWKNVFSDDSSSKPSDAASRAAQAMARYARREVSCLSLTDKEAIFSGNFLFTPLERGKLP